MCTSNTIDGAQHISHSANMVVMPMRQQNRLDRSLLAAQNTLQMFNVGWFVCITSVQQNSSIQYI